MTEGQPQHLSPEKLPMTVDQFKAAMRELLPELARLIADGVVAAQPQQPKADHHLSEANIKSIMGGVDVESSLRDIKESVDKIVESMNGLPTALAAAVTGGGS